MASGVQEWGIPSLRKEYWPTCGRMSDTSQANPCECILAASSAMRDSDMPPTVEDGVPK